MQELLQMFAVEAAEHIQTLSQTLLKLEKSPPPEQKKDLLNAAFRAAHSLKGSARAVELHDIEKIAHEAEAVLSAVRANKLDFDSEVVDLLLEGSDMIQNMVGGQKYDPAQVEGMAARLKRLGDIKTAAYSPDKIAAVIAELAAAPPEAPKAAPTPPPPPPIAPEPPKAPPTPPPVAEVPKTPPPAPEAPKAAAPAKSSSLDALMQELLQMFAVEAREHVQTLTQALLHLERNPGPAEKNDLLNAAFRAAHSLKGSARAVELMDIEGLAHESETVLSAVRANKLEFTPEMVDILLTAADMIQNLVEGQTADPAQLHSLRERLKEAAEGKTPPPATATPPTPPPTPPQAALVVQAPSPTPASVPPSPPAPQPSDSHPAPAPPRQTEAIPSRALSQWSKDKEKDGKKREPIKPSPLSTGASEDTIRVSVEKLDDLMAQAGELIVSKISADERLRELRDLRSLMARWEKAWGEATDLQRRVDRLSRETDHPEWQEVLDFIAHQQRYFGDSAARLRALDKAMGSDNMRMTLVTQGIQEEIRRVRMLPVETLVPTMERVLRDVARASQKKAQLLIRGADVELDKKVLEDLKDPLIHLLRNSVDHGIETPEERLAQGKPELGSVTMAVTQRGGNIHIIVADDGKGLDAEAIKRSSVEKGHIPQSEADTMSEEEAFLLIFHAGLSTKKEVTAVSGRGVGMDVVKAQLENLQGRIYVKSVWTQGTEFHLIVPISLATIRGLIVRIGLENYAIPLHAVEKIITIRGNTIYYVEGHKMFDLDGEPMSIIHLGDVLQRPRDPDREDRMLAIILAGAERRMAFLVDDAVSEQEMVVKPLGKQLRRVRNVSGATLLGTGMPIVILNATDLIKSAQGGRIANQAIYVERKSEAEALKPPPKILIVDDSITTRTLERNILQGAGYLVTTAVDGVEALALLESETFDLVVSDIEMPRIDGFELVEWIRQSPAYGQVPIILVTSLESQEHKERGMRVGADAYIVKSGFEQSVLLETIEEFL
jgi:two-component system chemotaxis sensor kinase CheA